MKRIKTMKTLLKKIKKMGKKKLDNFIDYDITLELYEEIKGNSHSDKVNYLYKKVRR